MGREGEGRERAPGVVLPLRAALYLADQNPHRDRSLGISTMTRLLARRLRQRGDVHLVPVSSQSSVRGEPEAGAKPALSWRTDRTLGRLAADHLHPWLVRPEVDVWFYPKGHLPLWTRPRQPTVGFLHDAILQHYADHYPDDRSRWALGYWLKVLASSVARLDHVLTPSQHARGQILSFCERRGIDAPPITVTYEASELEARVGERPRKGDYVLHLAAAAPHKRTAHLLGMWQEMGRGPAALPPLRLVGRLPDASLDLAQRLPGVTVSGHLAPDEFVDALSRARALLLPSEIEGFGLPALEAYYCSTPVCYVADTAVDEVLAPTEGRGRFALDDVDALSAALDDVLSMSPFEVETIGRALAERYACEAFAARVRDALYAAAGPTAGRMGRG